MYPQDKEGWVLLNPEGGPAITPVWSERGVEIVAAQGALSAIHRRRRERIGG